MAYDITLVPNLPTDTKAAVDLRLFQGRAVQINSAGVRPAFGAVVGSGRAFILAQAANSGEACALVSAGNVIKCYAGAALKVGEMLTINASAMVIPTTSEGVGGPFRGTALEAATTINHLAAVLVG
jgi:hypothetical protein